MVVKWSVCSPSVLQSKLEYCCSRQFKKMLLKRMKINKRGPIVLIFYFQFQFSPLIVQLWQYKNLHSETSPSKADSHSPQQSAFSAIDCINAEIEKFLSFCGGAAVQCGIRTSVNEFTWILPMRWGGKTINFASPKTSLKLTTPKTEESR